MTDMERPDQRTTADRANVKVTAKALDVSSVDPVVVGLRRRRGESWRCVPMDDGRRDTLEFPPGEIRPATFGLRPAEVAAEAARLLELGWFPAEVLVRLDVAA